MADSSPKPYSVDPTLYLYTSLTAGSSHIITATSRLETILKANKIPFRALDVATDEKARMLWGRRSKGKKLPGLVKLGQVVGDMEQIEEWNEYGELQQNIAAFDDFSSSSATTSAASAAPASVPAATSESASKSISEGRSQRHISIAEPSPGRDAGPASSLKKDDTPLTMAMRQAGAEAAAKAGQMKSQKASVVPSTPPTSTDTPAPVTGTKLDKAHADLDTVTDITAAKHPAQLASEGAQRTTVDKIADAEPDTTTPVTASAHSNEEQLLEARRSSSITKQPSRLVQQTSVDDVDGTKESEEAAEQPASDTSPALNEAAAASGYPEKTGEDKEEVKDKEEQEPPKELEATKTKPIATSTSADDHQNEKHKTEDEGAKAGEEEQEETEEEEAAEDDEEEKQEAEEVKLTTPGTAADKFEKPTSEATKPQELEAKDGEAASVSVGD